MGKTSSGHPADDHGHASHGGGHAVVEESAEQRADRERSERIESSIVDALRIPGAVFAVFCGAIGVAALITSAGESAMVWAWLLLLALIGAWGLGLARDSDAFVMEEPSAPSGH